MGSADERCLLRHCQMSSDVITYDELMQMGNGGLEIQDELMQMESCGLEIHI